MVMQSQEPHSSEFAHKNQKPRVGESSTDLRLFPFPSHGAFDIWSD